MKKNLCSLLGLVLTIALLTSIMPIFAVAAEITGTGEVDDPYVITEPAHFEVLRNNPTKIFELASNLTLPTDFVPISTFSGTLKGIDNCNVITLNLSGTDNMGLFASITSGTVENIILDGSVSGKQYVGALAGKITGSAKIIKCINDATVTSTNTGATMNIQVGGLIGEIPNYVNATIENCGNNKAVTQTGLGQYVGGLIGSLGAGSTVKHSYNKGTVTGNAYVGGIVGYGSHGVSRVEYCYNSGNIIATKGNAGGLVAYLKGELYGSYNTGSVEATSYAGGLSAYADHAHVKIQNCFNVGMVNGASVAAGIVGSAENVALTIENTYNAGTVKCGRPAYLYPIYFSGVVLSNATLSNLYYMPSSSYLTVKERTTQATASNLVNNELTGINTVDIWNVLPLSDLNKYPFPQFVENPYYGEYDLTGLIEDKVNFAGGFGSTESPYLISTIDHLKNISLKPNAVFSQTQNIEIELTEPIGEFGGKYLGNGYSILLNINDNTKSIMGLFTTLNGATIDAVVTKGLVNGFGYVGGLAGEANGVTVITNCVNEATIKSLNGRTGGIVGSFYNTTSGAKIEKCVNKGLIDSSFINVGGITGILTGQVILCKNLGSVSGCDVGGIVGYSYGTITKSYNLGSVILKDEAYYAAGIVAKTRAINAFVSDCYNAGNIEGRNTSGIMHYTASTKGSADIKILNSYHAGIATNPITSANSESAVANCYYLSYDLKTDGLDSSAISTTDPTIAVSSATLSTLNIGSTFVVNATSETYIYPQIVGNTQTEEVEFVLLTVQIEEGLGASNLTGNHYVRPQEKYKIIITPSVGHYINSIKRGDITIVEGHNGEKIYTLPMGATNETISISFKELLLSDEINISSPIAYTPAILESYYLEDETEITTYGISFATAKNIYANYSLIEYGMLFSKNSDHLAASEITIDGNKVKKAVANYSEKGLGQYGILFYGNGILPNTTYYTKSYAIYQNKQNPELTVTVYGNEVNSFMPIF